EGGVLRVLAGHDECSLSEKVGRLARILALTRQVSLRLALTLKLSAFVSLSPR
ncbi:hypothetical protein A2U01_0040227, partial [Trifolium medium]|nr:hypothetical protein [Trifolium medium]